MTHEKDEKICLLDQVRAGASVDDLPALVSDDAIEVIRGKQELRNSALELFADSAFYKAANALVSLLDCEDPKVAVAAAGKLLDLRKEVYKMQNTKKIVKAVTNKLFDDGFNF